MNKYKVLKGTHSQAGVMYDSADPNNNIVETTLDLEEMFPNSFERIIKEAPESVADVVKKVAAKELGPTVDRENVTEQFDDCDVVGFEVFKIGKKGYSICEDDVQLNEKLIKSKKKVQAFINEYIEEDED